MSYIDKFVTEFDEENSILHLTSSEDIHINSIPQGMEFVKALTSILEKYTSENRCYLIVNIARIAVDPALSQQYAQTIINITEKFLYPDGIVGYGFQITRITSQISHEKNYLPGESRVFSNRQEAYSYIKRLKKTRLQSIDTGSR